ncbi:MAG: AIR synthase-related protein, partial [Erysipelotrichaceae bacterium]
MKITVYTEKRNGFAQDAIDLKQQALNLLQIECDVRVLNGYAVDDISSNDVDKAIKYVFSEPMVDKVYDKLPHTTGTIIAREPLPGQYDQRSDSAVQCLKCLDFESNPIVKSFQVVLFNRVLSKEEENRFIKFWINPVEMRVKELNKEVIQIETQNEPNIEDFCLWTDQELKIFLKKESAAMSIDDLKLIQDYFKQNENRDLTYTEFKVLDTYWSDHCRHTTFETEITDFEIEDSPYAYVIKETLNQFYEMRKHLNRDHKAVTLMELATMFGRYRKDPRVEISDEINACSVVIDVNTDMGQEEWLLMFKNETHNHPTEIEPFGGASTCIGGAIRDPLSGRSYVYQAMRISGCGNVKESFDSTLENKLPQRIIASKATQGNSSYGNQIGVCTSFVKEIYHPSYVAKHLECGAVIGAVKKEHVKRLKPEVNDIVILLGGRTGRDGIGGATGSSKIHSNTSLKQSGSEVQKGNAPEERKLQRLFRNPNVTKLIKKANDFGAGGVCVAIGELADGCEIWLDKVSLKYEGLNPTEIAISESQERMAVVIDPSDCEKFMEYAQSENIEAMIVARITDNNRLCMKYHDQVVVNLNRDLINTNGVRQKVKSILSLNPITYPKPKELNELSLLEHLNSLNVTSQKGLIEQFDGSIGATTVLYPLGGKTQLTPSIASVQKIAIEKNDTTTVSILAYGFNPSLSEINPFLSAQASVLESIAKTICVGGKIDNIYFSFQEYFAKLYQDPKKWGNVVQTLLGAQSIQS